MPKAGHGRGAIAAIGLVLLFAGVVGGAVLWVLADREPNKAAESFARAAPGCTTTLTFGEPGEYFVYEELSGVSQAVEGCQPSTLPGRAFTFTVTTASGVEVPRVEDTTMSYDLDVGAATSVARITIEAAGDYRISVLGDDPATVAAVGGDPEADVEQLRRGAIAAATGGVVLGLLLLFLAGRRSKRAATFAGPLDPGWGVTERDHARRAAASVDDGTTWPPATTQVPVNPHAPDERRVARIERPPTAPDAAGFAMPPPTQAAATGGLVAGAMPGVADTEPAPGPDGVTELADRSAEPDASAGAATVEEATPEDALADAPAANRMAVGESATGPADAEPEPEGAAPGSAAPAESGTPDDPVIPPTPSSELAEPGGADAVVEGEPSGMTDGPGGSEPDGDGDDATPESGSAVPGAADISAATSDQGGDDVGAAASDAPDPSEPASDDARDTVESAVAEAPGASDPVRDDEGHTVADSPTDDAVHPAPTGSDVTSGAGSDAEGAADVPADVWPGSAPVPDDGPSDERPTGRDDAGGMPSEDDTPPA